jgi:hypothetical protein
MSEVQINWIESVVIKVLSRHNAIHGAMEVCDLTTETYLDIATHGGLEAWGRVSRAIGNMNLDVFHGMEAKGLIVRRIKSGRAFFTMA